jgi:hypothetical protein
MPFFILAGASLLGAGIGAIGSASAANTEANASQAAAAQQMQMFQQVQANEAPYVQAGDNALTTLQTGLGLGPGGTGTGPLDAPFNPTDLAGAPGYQFTLDQGEQAIDSAATASGGVGGANTLKALGGYAEGLASTTYQQQLQDYMAQQQQTTGALGGLVTTGANAGSNSATGASTFGANIGASTTAAGQASAAGTLGVTNALGGGISSLSSNYLLANLLGGPSGLGGGGGNANPFTGG